MTVGLSISWCAVGIHSQVMCEEPFQYISTNAKKPYYLLTGRREPAAKCQRNSYKTRYQSWKQLLTCHLSGVFSKLGQLIEQRLENVLCRAEVDPKLCFLLPNLITLYFLSSIFSQLSIELIVQEWACVMLGLLLLSGCVELITVWILSLLQRA